MPEFPALPPIGGEVWALASGFLWAAGVVLFALAGESIAPLPLNLFKSVLSLLFLVPAVLLVDGTVAPEWDGRTWAAVAVSGLIGITLADTMFFMALNRLGAGLNAIVDCMYYPCMVATAATMLGEPVQGTDVVGGGFVVAGVLLASLSRPKAERKARTVLVGIAVGTLGMVLVAVSVALIDDILARESVLTVTTCRLAVATLGLVPLGLVDRRSRAVLARLSRPGPLWRHAVPAAVVGGALAMWTWLAGFSAADVSRAAVMNQLSTIWISLLAVVVLAEPFTTRRLLALALAFGGALLVMSG